jgi:hypothetical protein
MKHLVLKQWEIKLLNLPGGQSFQEGIGKSQDSLRMKEGAPLLSGGFAVG